MSDDARFEDAADRPLRLMAATGEDVQVVSALLQDAVVSMADITWLKGRRRFAMLANRFRWEDRDAARRANRAFERVRAMLVIDDVMAVRASGVDPSDKELILSVLSLEFTEGEDGAGRLKLILSGDGEILLDVEAINLTIDDVTKPYAAPSGRAPEHPLD